MPSWDTRSGLGANFPNFPAWGRSLSPSFSTGEYGCSFSNPQYRSFQSSCETSRALRVMFLYSSENSESKQDRHKVSNPMSVFSVAPSWSFTVSSDSLPTRKRSQNRFLSAQNFYPTIGILGLRELVNNTHQSSGEVEFASIFTGVWCVELIFHGKRKREWKRVDWFKEGKASYSSSGSSSLSASCHCPQ